MKKKPISEYPHMMAQWHPAKNPQFDVNTTAAGTKEKAWWLCSKCGYEWQSLISTRRDSRGYCPRCDKDKQGPKTTVTISMVPHLMDYFDQDANPDIDPYTLTATKRKKANWKCPVCGYKWTADINTRYYEKTGCLACLGRATVPGVNDVLTLVPEIEYYYDSEHPDNPDLRTLRVSSKDVVHWVCPDCGRKWEQPIRFRIGKKSGKYYVKKCSRCSRYAHELSYLEKYPEAAALYSSSNEIPFKDLHAKDRMSVFLWDCPECGYEFESTLGSMLKLARKPLKGCPLCTGRFLAAPGKSLADLYPELLAELDDDTDLYKVLPNSSKEIHWKCNTCGYKWTTTAALRHMGFGKCPACNYYRPVKGYNTVEDLFVDIAKQWSSSNTYQPDELMPTSGEWVMLICPECGGEHSVRISHATAGNIKCPFCNELKVAPGINSLDVTNPELVPLWSKANTRDISTVANFMSLTAYWDCPDCGGTYPAEIKKMVSGETYCKYCANESLLTGFNSLDKTNPELVPEWSSRNNLPMSQVKAYSWYRAYWICPICGGEHLATIKDHMEGIDSCKYCENRAVLPGFNSFAAKHHDLLEEWDYANNYIITDPDEISESSNVTVWWRCRKNPDHDSYPMSVSSRVMFKIREHVSCPICKGRRRKKKHFV